MSSCARYSATSSGPNCIFFKKTTSKQTYQHSNLVKFQHLMAGDECARCPSGPAVGPCSRSEHTAKAATQSARTLPALPRHTLAADAARRPRLHRCARLFLFDHVNACHFSHSLLHATRACRADVDVLLMRPLCMLLHRCTCACCYNDAPLWACCDISMRLYSRYN